MSRLTLLKRNKLLAFTVGTLIFVILLPGIFSLTSNFLQINNQAVNKVALATANSPANYTSPLGSNLSGIADWSTELPFLDAFKSARKWITQCAEGTPNCPFDTQEEKLLDLDANGWIKSLPAPSATAKYRRVETPILTLGSSPYPAKRYVVLYEGEGTLKYGFAQKDEAKSKPGRDVIEIAGNSAGTVFLSINATDPNKTGKYIRKIRVIREEQLNLYERGEIFNPDFIDKIKNFRALRFMDWMGTNNSEQKEWADRPKIENASYAWKGVPVEIMVALANKIKADPWFNMPHRATDEYIAKFAQMVKNSLGPNLKAYVEFSNEVWNWGFQQSHHALKQGKARWGQDKGDAHIQWYGMRVAQMSDIWKSVFGNQKNRVVSVMATQTGWYGLENSALDCPLWVAEGNKPCYQNGIDAYAITGYFDGNLSNPKYANTVRSWMKEPDGGFSKAFQQLRDGSVIPDSGKGMADVNNGFIYHAKVAKEKKLQLVVYEGGQSIAANLIVGSSNDDTIINFFAEINRRSEMYNLYMELLNYWKKAGGTLFNNFSDVGLSSKWGSWGALEYVNQKGSPKYNALMDFIKNNPCWWDGCGRNFTQNKPT